MGPNFSNNLEVTRSYRVGQRPSGNRTTSVPLAQLSNYIHSLRASTNCSLNISKPGATSNANAHDQTSGHDNSDAAAEKPAAKRRKR
ncbi:MAG: hypothetical protein RLZZ430_1577 [Cyanobacteriota bacterium]|jgi:hypothetical protein